MAYNLESLVTVLEGVLCPDQRRVLHYKTTQQIEFLLQKVCFLREYFLANSSTISEARIRELEDHIRGAAENAEDAVETYFADRNLSRRLRFWSYFYPLNLQKVLEEFDSLKEQTMRIVDRGRITYNTSRAVSSTKDPNPKKILVGIRETKIKLLERVTESSSKLETISILGMGGIGKTTLAQNIYDDSYIISRFDVRAWITVSDDCSLRGILLGLLGCIMGKHTNKMLEEKNDQILGIALHKNLKGRRYLIVLDDMWLHESWDDVKRFFPNDENGSRIILTTRVFTLATYVDSKSPHYMCSLNIEDSWELLMKKVFGEETCPPELEELVKRITISCQGLPLAIHVIGGVLSHVTRTKESWEQVANDISSGKVYEDNNILRILSSSYNHLPHYLKPCFLYMGAFSGNYEIRASKLIRLWVAEGFLKPIENKSLEEAAEVYLKALVDRDLIFVCKQETNGNVRTYGMLDLLRELCVEKARQKNFLLAQNGESHCIPNGTLNHRRVSVHTSISITGFYGSKRQMLLARSSGNRIRSFPRRSSSACKLKLRHIKVMGELLSCMRSDWINFVLHENLQSLSMPTLEVYNFQKVLEKLPNLRKLRISNRFISLFNVSDWTCLHKLEKLNFSTDFSAIWLPDLTFPPFLKNLTLYKCGVSSQTMRTVGMLPKLEILKLQKCTFESPNWEPSEGEFDRLQFLLLENLNLVKWTADQNNFPRLQHLIIRECSAIEDISTDLDEIPTLEIIEVDESSPFVAATARKNTGRTT